MIGRALKLAAVIETVGVLVVSLSQRGVLSRLGLLTNVRKGNGCCGDRSQGDSLRLSAVTALGLRCVEGESGHASHWEASRGKPGTQMAVVPESSPRTTLGSSLEPGAGHARPRGTRSSWCLLEACSEPGAVQPRRPQRLEPTPSRLLVGHQGLRLSLGTWRVDAFPS